MATQQFAEDHEKYGNATAWRVRHNVMTMFEFALDRRVSITKFTLGT